MGFSCSPWYDERWKYSGSRAILLRWTTDVMGEQLFQYLKRKKRITTVYWQWGDKRDSLRELMLPWNINTLREWTRTRLLNDINSSLRTNSHRCRWAVMKWGKVIILERWRTSSVNLFIHHLRNARIFSHWIYFTLRNKRILYVYHY